MNSSLALHTAARQYCIREFAYWSDCYMEIHRRGEDRQGDGYTDVALATFPRYNILRAIRIEVERIDPKSLDDVESTRSLLILAGEIADDIFTRNPIGTIDRLAVAEERVRFCIYLRDISHDELTSIEPIPYRRVISAEESRTVWAGLRRRWEITDNYWFPLAPCSLVDVKVFHSPEFEKAVPADWIRTALKSKGIDRIWDLGESSSEYEEDIAWFDPYYDGCEHYWSSSSHDWVMYVSHEETITIGGWILEAIKTHWPAWETGEWVTNPPT